jgi:arylsulfatase A-like enzyme
MRTFNVYLIFKRQLSQLITTMALALSCRGTLVHASENATASRPNVIVIITDDQGYGDIGAHGNTRIKTPNLDALHAESVRFIDFHVSPMCTPSRGQLMSGVDALRSGAVNVSSGRTMLRRDLPTMADVFRSNGYRTALFGKWHLGDNYPYRPQDRGFEETVTFPSSHISSAPDAWNNDYFDDTYLHNGQRQKYEGFCTDVFFGEAKHWIAERTREQAAGKPAEPFFVYLAVNAPHSPHFAPKKYRDLYHGENSGERAAFYGMISNIDDNMGALDQFLRESGLRDNTILIFLTDNGTTLGARAFNAGMRGRKVSLYEGGHRVPLFVRWPAGNLQKPRDVDGLAEAQDLLPTLIELAGVKKPVGAQFDGISLASVLRGEAKEPPDRTLFVQFSRMDHPSPTRHDAAVLWGKWRLVKNRELYNLTSDPGQKHDVASTQPVIMNRLQAAYNKWWGAVSPGLNYFGEIVIGNEAENPVMLSPVDWHDVFLDQSQQVRAGIRRNGAWYVRVDQAGRYRFSLRRWPIEADAPIAAGMPAYAAVDGTLPTGRALPIHGARLEVGALSETKPVMPGDKETVFELELQPGPAKVQTAFTDGDGDVIAGAYYLYVQRL